MSYAIISSPHSPPSAAQPKPNRSLNRSRSVRRAADSDAFDAVSQRIQLEKIDRILIQVTAGKDQEKKRTIFWLRHRQGFTASEIAAIPSIGLTTEGVESVLLRLSLMIRSHFASSVPHREVKVLNRQNRSKRIGG
jgi:DNA-directed RNA polymerase specialized sigma24 family protein